jgi:predicted membrane metal-binding protein
MSVRDVVAWIVRRLIAVILSVVLYTATTGIYIVGYMLSFLAFTLKLGPTINHRTITYLLITCLLNATIASISIIVILKGETS